MALFNNWFSVKAKQKTGTAVEGAGIAAPSTSPDAVPDGTASRRTIRLQRRELLYSAIREAMVHAGVLSTSYKFKVLSLDSQGRQYLVMMDLVRDGASDMMRLAEIEAQIMQSAKALHDILVTAVYWRANEHPAAGYALQPQPPASAVSPSDAALPAAGMAPDFLAAFDRAAMPDRREALSSSDFEDTVIEDPSDPAPPRKATQYGDLN